jgi:D-arginine dehydrogenase
MRQPHTTDIAIVGAGIAGASLAWALTQGDGPAPRVVLLEREAQPGYHTTGRSAALYMASYGPPGVQALTRASRHFYDNPPPGFTAHPLLSPRGVLHVATEAELPALDALQPQLQAVDPSVRRVGTAELLARVPCLRPEAAVAGLVEASAADIDVHALHQGYLRAARQAGAALWTQADLVALTAGAHGTWTLALADGRRLRARQVVNAAGAWADVVGALAGAAPIGLSPRRRSAFTFASPEGVDASRWPAVAAVVADHGPDAEDGGGAWYIKPDAGLILGSPANADRVPPHDVVPEELDIALGIHRIEQATTLQIRRPRSTWAGLRSFVADGEMVIGPDPVVPGFFWLAAQGGYGIQSAPGAAALAASLLQGRPLPAELQREGVDPATTSPARLQR